MNELIAAAKIVIDLYDYTGTAEECEAVNRLIEAVERAEKPSADFMEWWKTFPLNTYGIVPAFHGWTAAQQAERERIRARAKLAAERTWRAGGCYVGPQHYIIEKFVETLLEDGDAAL